MAMVENRAEHGVEIGLRQLVIEPLADQLRIMIPRFAPALTMDQLLLRQGTLQPLQGRADLLLIQVDPFSRCLLRFAPGGLTKTPAGIIGNSLEPGPVFIEAVQNGSSKAVGGRVLHENLRIRVTDSFANSRPACEPTMVEAIVTGGQAHTASASRFHHHAVADTSCFPGKLPPELPGRISCESALSAKPGHPRSMASPTP